MSGAIQLCSQSGELTPMESYRGDLTNVVPVVQDGDRLVPVREDLANKLLVVFEAFQAGRIQAAQMERAYNTVLSQTQTEALATVERVSDRALAIAASTVATQNETIKSLANALATKSTASPNVSVKVETVERDRFIWIDPEFFAIWTILISVVGMTALIVTADLVRRPQPQSALPSEVKGYEPPPTIGHPTRTGRSGGRFV